MRGSTGSEGAANRRPDARLVHVGIASTSVASRGLPFAVFGNLSAPSAGVTTAAVRDAAGNRIVTASVLAGVIACSELVPRERLSDS